ncbi:leucine-rich repeat domain-containing protein [Skeletonema marinoi]|uniref:Leucine-rich repeat domain-containing protein n=1 Tax=Skeletonema marinoi TaxID=267567 RepID=A0AAD8XWK2_9STRA|nr:leucine-rich repeat domain-containing protein [Skeletonema marinoi]
MADHANNGNEGGGGDRDIFVYRGGRAPRNVTHVRIDKSVEVIEDRAFNWCRDLVHVETHDGIRKVGRRAFFGCESLRSIDLRSVVEIGEDAFEGCEDLMDVQFGNKLETIGMYAFYGCTSLECLKLPSIITVETAAFKSCDALSSIEFSERLERIELNAFCGCERLRHIAIPLKRDLLPFDHHRQKFTQFDDCDLLTAVDLVGGAHNKTVASLHIESWRTEMIAEIDRINQDLPNIPANEKTESIKQWVDSVIDRMDHYKAEHHRYVKEAVTLLELALWKAKLDEIEENAAERKTKTVNIIDAESVRKEKRVTCGADLVIRNILPFLKLE